MGPASCCSDYHHNYTTAFPSPSIMDKKAEKNWGYGEIIDCFYRLKGAQVKGLGSPHRVTQKGEKGETNFANRIENRTNVMLTTQ